MSREVRVGLMFVLSIAILGTSLYFLGNFQELVSYKIKFDKVNGLAVDSPVQFNGVPIGRVTKIVLSEEFEAGEGVPIIVTVSVHRSVRDHIRTSTVADIKSVGVLGDKSILLITKDYRAELLEENGYIKDIPKALDVEKLLEQGTDLVTDVSDITKDLKRILNQMAEEDALLMSLMGDKELANNLKSGVTNILADLQNENGLMALLLKDPEFANQFKNSLSSITGNVDSLTKEYGAADGLVPTLMKDTAYRDEVQGQVNELLTGANALVKTLAESEGLVHKMTQDKEYGDRVAQNLEKASHHLASILEKIDEGEGSASLLINDPSLYQGVYEVVYGVQHSGLTKWYIQRKQRKGAKLKQKENKP